MMKWIRWKGIAAFVVVVALFAAFWLLLVDRLVEMAVEKAGTRAVGARVEVARADVTLFPAGVALFGLQVTDPQKPMQNMIRIDKLHAALEMAPLLRRKVIVDDLRVEGLDFNTERKTSGALPGKAPETEGQGEPAIPPWLTDVCGGKPALRLTLPSVDEIMQREPLQTLAQATQIQTRIQAAQTDWKRRLEELPDRQDLEAYKARIQKVKSGGKGLAAMLGGANEAKTLLDDIQKDLQRLKESQGRYKSDLAELKKQTADLAKAPFQEAKRLQEKYALSAAGAANLSRTLFGPQVCGWWQKGYAWYQRLKPYLARLPAKKGEPETVKPVRGKGLDVRFTERKPLPDFLIRQVHVDARLDTGKFTGQLTDITSQPNVLGRPLTFKFLGRQMKQLQALNLDGVFDLVRPDKPHHSVKMLVKELDLQDLDLSRSGGIPLSIARALTDLHLDLDLAGPELKANLDAQLRNVTMALQEAAGDDLAKAMGEALEAVRKFGLTVAVKGTAPEYAATLKSDLDRILQRAVGQMVKKAGAELQARLRQTIAEQTKGPIDQAQTLMGGLDALGPEFTQRLDLGNKLLKDLKLPF